ncbi:MAG: hypothetical protein Q8N35_08725, partial [Methylococcaceae bacterium]|nr:hypothetical protein [Methylococcaceae bacterium]
ISIYTTFLQFRINELQNYFTPSPAGEGWGEEIKINHLDSPHPSLLPLEKGPKTCVDSYASKGGRERALDN